MQPFAPRAWQPLLVMGTRRKRDGKSLPSTVSPPDRGGGGGAGNAPSCSLQGRVPPRQAVKRLPKAVAPLSDETRDPAKSLETVSIRSNRE
jgi:hypothetical protein